MELKRTTYVDADGELTHDPAKGMLFVGHAGKVVHDAEVARLRNAVKGGAYGLRHRVPSAALVDPDQPAAKQKRLRLPFGDKARKASKADK